MVSRAGNVKDGVGDGGRAGSDGQGSHASFQGGDPLLQDVLRGVRQAAVDIAGIGESETRGGMLGVVEDVRGGLVDGDRAGVGDGVGGFLADMELQGLELVSAHGIPRFVRLDRRCPWWVLRSLGQPTPRRHRQLAHPDETRGLSGRPAPNVPERRAFDGASWSYRSSLPSFLPSRLVPRVLTR